MTNEEKRDRVIRYLTESHLDSEGGYPYDYDVFMGVVFIAGLDDAKERNRTELLTYNTQHLVDWYDRAADYITTVGCDDQWPDEGDFDFGYWPEAFEETRDTEDDDNASR